MPLLKASRKCGSGVMVVCDVMYAFEIFTKFGGCWNLVDCNNVHIISILVNIFWINAKFSFSQ